MKTGCLQTDHLMFLKMNCRRQETLNLIGTCSRQLIMSCPMHLHNNGSHVIYHDEMLYMYHLSTCIIVWDQQNHSSG